jgi:hypothetical protein
MQYNVHLTQEQLLLQLDKEVGDTLAELDYRESFERSYPGVLFYSNASWTKTTNPIDFFYGNPDTDEPYAPIAEELTKYSLLSNNPERQIAYELRGMGL